ncbi:MAG: hypothetical protein IBJ01_08455 [Leptospira sp.]|uniref:hypothetical protein n=1 Tax=Leptospira sp. TaxID=178 RepID=UPI0025BFA54F|nr:hypothetical protein [Leptospira sp.]MBL0954780.1 hypothetical protein [Leptospira sp.]
MKKTIFLLIFLSSFFVSLFAQEFKYNALTSIESHENFQQFMKFYYTNPKSILIPSAINFIIDQKINETKENERHIVPFFAQIFRTHDDKVPEWFANITKLSDDDKFIFAHAMFLSEGNNGKKEIQKFLESTENEELKQVFTRLSDNRKPIDLRTVTLTNPVYLDMLWSSFFASGDVSYLEKLLLATETKKKTIEEVLIFSAARWSMKANAQEHKKVFDFCIKNKGKHTKDINLFLEDFIE